MASGCLLITPASVYANRTSRPWYPHPMPPSPHSRLLSLKTKVLPSYKDKAQGCRLHVVPSLRCSRHLGLAHVLPESRQLNMAMKARQRWHTQNDNKSGLSAAVMVQTTSVRLRG